MDKIQQGSCIYRPAGDEVAHRVHPLAETGATLYGAGVSLSASAVVFEGLAVVLRLRHEGTPLYIAKAAFTS